MRENESTMPKGLDLQLSRSQRLWLLLIRGAIGVYVPPSRRLTPPGPRPLHRALWGRARRCSSTTGTRWEAARTFSRQPSQYNAQQPLSCHVLSFLQRSSPFVFTYGSQSFAVLLPCRRRVRGCASTRPRRNNRAAPSPPPTIVLLCGGTPRCLSRLLQSAAVVLRSTRTAVAAAPSPPP